MKVVLSHQQYNLIEFNLKEMLKKQDPLSNLMMFEALSSIFESLFKVPDSIKILEGKFKDLSLEKT